MPQIPTNIGAALVGEHVLYSSSSNNKEYIQNNTFKNCTVKDAVKNKVNSVYIVYIGRYVPSTTATMLQDDVRCFYTRSDAESFIQKYIHRKYPPTSTSVFYSTDTVVFGTVSKAYICLKTEEVYTSSSGKTVTVSDSTEEETNIYLVEVCVHSSAPAI